MTCLSEEQLAQFALGLTEDADAASHLNECAACRTNLDAMRSLTHQLTEIHAKFGDGHEKARERLLATLPAAIRRPEPAGHWNRVTHFLGELTMRQRLTALGGVGVAALLGFLLIWGLIDTKPVSAMEQVAENVRNAKSYKCTEKVTLKASEMVGELPKTMRAGLVYWLSPNLRREDFTFASVWNETGPERTTIDLGNDRQLFVIDNRAKTFCYSPPGLGDDSPVGRLENLGRFVGDADRKLGTKEINGKKARGFEITTNKIDPTYPPSRMEVWLDSEINLPVLVCVDMKTERGFLAVQISDIQWDIDLDVKLFEPTPPDGYKDVTPKPLVFGELVHQITEALKLYAEASGGHYPQTNHVVLGDLGKLMEVLGMITTKTENGVTTSKLDSVGKKITPEQVHKIGEGFRQIQGIDHVFYGKAVGPNDKDKVLLRWKLDDGRYEVIFGDLHAETVTTEKLHTLEEK